MGPLAEAGDLTDGVPRHRRRAAPLLFLALLPGCTDFSIREEDASAGLNGGFEVVRAGLPVNWFFHNRPIVDGAVIITLDTEAPAEGLRSLRMDVRDTADQGSWRTAGFFQVVPADPLRAYRVSFRLRNRGSIVQVAIRSENASEASTPIAANLGPPDTGTDEWRSFAWDYTVPDGYGNIRFQLTFLQPGTIWVDDVRIEPQ